MQRVSAQLSWGVGHREQLLHCSHWRAVAAIIDTWAFTFVILNNVTATSAVLHRARSTPALVVVAPALMFVLWSLLQRCASRRWPDAYYRNHIWILLFNRLIRVPMLAVLLLETRTRCRDPSIAKQLQAYLSTGRAFSTPAIELFTSTLGISGSMLLLMHASAAPLPFIPQLIMQAASATAVLLCQSQPAALLIAKSPLRATSHTVCTRLNALFAASSRALGIYTDVEALQAACRPHSPRLLVMFTQLYFGFALPVCFSYRLQSYLLLFLRAASRSSYAGDVGSSSSGSGSGGTSSDRSSSMSSTGTGTGTGWSSSRRGTGGTTNSGRGSSSEVSSEGGPPERHGRGYVSLPAAGREQPQLEDLGWPHVTDTPARVLADVLVLAYLVPSCWVCAVVLRPVVDALAWPIDMN